jgi:hypothetical protein
MPCPTRSAVARTAATATAVVGLVSAPLLAPDHAAAAPGASVAASDYTSDGAADVLTVNDAGQLGLYAGDGRGGWRGSTLVGNGWSGYTVITPGDFTGDGRADVVGIPATGELYLYPGTGSGGFGGKVQIGQGWQGFREVFSPGDFDGDGHADIIGITATGDMRLYTGTGTGRVSGSSQIGHGWDIYTHVAAGGDFDGDGRADIFATDSAGRLYAYYNRGGNALSGRSQVGNGWAAYTQLRSVGDFTGDGATDLFAVDSRSGAAFVYPGTGRGSFAGGRLELGTDWQRPATSAPQQTTPVTGDFTYERDQLYRKLSDLRASKGLRPLARSAELNARAQAWAKHMAETQNMYHTPNFRAEMTAAGWSYKSELVVRNTGGRRMDVDDVLTFMHDWWVASPNHYPWMVSPNYTHVGHGYYMGPGGPYAVTVLGGR